MTIKEIIDGLGTILYDEKNNDELADKIAELFKGTAEEVQRTHAGAGVYVFVHITLSIILSNLMTGLARNLIDPIGECRNVLKELYELLNNTYSFMKTTEDGTFIYADDIPFGKLRHMFNSLGYFVNYLNKNGNIPAQESYLTVTEIMSSAVEKDILNYYIDKYQYGIK